MEPVEAGLRRALAAVADGSRPSAPTPNPRPAPTSAMPTRTESHRRVLMPVLAAASVIAVAGAAYGTSTVLDAGPGDPRPPASASSTAGAQGPGADEERAVERFVQGVMDAHGVTVQPSVDWENGVILLAVPAPVDPALAELDGGLVGGLTVDVREALVSQADYESFIVAVGKADFPHKARIVSFSLLPGGTGVVVNLSDLDALSDSEQRGLMRHLEALTPASVQLVQAVDGSPL